MGSYQHYTPGPCPVCRSAPAIMGSTEFRPFDGNVCSAECGRKAKRAVEAAMTSTTYQLKRSKVERLRHEMAAIIADAIAEA